MIRIAEIVPVGHACRSRRKPGVYRDPEKRRRYHAAHASPPRRTSSRAGA